MNWINGVETFDEPANWFPSSEVPNDNGETEDVLITPGLNSMHPSFKELLCIKRI